MSLTSNNASAAQLGALQEALRTVPELSLGVPQVAHEGPFDYAVDLAVEGRIRRVLIECKRQVFPRDARELLWRVSADPVLRHKLEDATLLVMADHVSEGAREAFKAQRVGYFDAAGNLYLPAPGLLINVEKPGRTAPRRLMNLFSERRAEVVHALLAEHVKGGMDDWFGVRELAQMTHAPPSTVSDTMQLLEQMDFVEASGKGPARKRKLIRPDALLDAWAMDFTASHREMERFFVPGSAGTGALLAQVGQTFQQNQVAYAVSHEAAAQHYAPYLTTVSQVRCRAIEGDGLARALASLGAKRVDRGFNFAIWPVNGHGEIAFSVNANGVTFASVIHTYLDLLGGEGRSAELAQHLRKERIGF